MNIFSVALISVMLLTGCVTETPLSSAVPITASSPVAAEQPAIEDDTAVQKFAAIFCVNRKTFEKAVKNERLKFYGVIPAVNKFIVEIYAAPPGGSGFTIAVRNATQDEVCIMLAGSDLVPVAWFSESGI
jgi:hypothetical protein|tara:strand:+ start:660 stop:1049 length:390 start_codon:yes stop_codon:yes gene_type:complete